MHLKRFFLRLMVVSIYTVTADKESIIMQLKNLNLKLNAICVLISFCHQKANLG